MVFLYLLPCETFLLNIKYNSGETVYEYINKGNLV